VEPICYRPFQLPVPHYSHHASVSTPRSSNRTCRFTASGSRRRLTQSPKPLHVTLSATSENNVGVVRLIANLPFYRRFLRPPSTGRVRWWRGSGLRMMPTFPPPPLSFRTAGFPQYGWKVAFQVVPSPMSLRLSQHQACPAHHVGLHPPFVHSAAPLYVPLCVGTVDSVAHCHARSCLLYPRGPRFGLGSIVPVHPRLIGLIRPTHRHIPISPHCGLYGMPSLC